MQRLTKIILLAMNWFYLFRNRRAAARLLGDPHLTKMPLETTQLLSNVYHVHESKLKPCPYKPTHLHHPWTIWACRRKRNFLHMAAYGLALCIEFRSRRGKAHGCEKHIINMLRNPPKFNKHLRPTQKPWTRMVWTGKFKIPLCMPEEFHAENATLAYRRYYFSKVLNLAKRDGFHRYYKSPLEFVRLARVASATK